MADQSDLKLRACPFCAGLAEMFSTSYPRAEYMACCSDEECLGHQPRELDVQDNPAGWYNSSESAVAAAARWNTRSSRTPDV